MITLLAKERFLEPRSLEAALRAPALWDDAAQAPSARLREAGGLLLDLRRVQWVDVAAVAHLAVLVEAVLRDGLIVHVAMPDVSPMRGELRILAQPPSEFVAAGVRSRIAARERAASVLRHLRFIDALSEAAVRHGASARFAIVAADNVSARTQDGDAAVAGASEDPATGAATLGDGAHAGFTGPGTREPSGDSVHNAAGAAAGEDNPEASAEGGEGEAPVAGELERAESASWTDFRFMTPMRWLSAADAVEVDAFAQHVTQLLGDPDRGLQPVHARALSNVIFHELLQNVHTHSQSATHALVVAWARPSTRRLVTQAYLEHEQGFAEWVRANDTPMLEIVIADAGHGVHATLREAYERSERGARPAPPSLPWSRRDARVLAWAWDAWSTRDPAPRRGTRGLYRVDRVVGMYQGLAVIRSGRECAGWDHGGRAHDRRVATYRALGPTPGTIVRLYLPAVPIDASAPRWLLSPRRGAPDAGSAEPPSADGRTLARHRDRQSGSGTGGPLAADALDVSARDASRADRAAAPQIAFLALGTCEPLGLTAAQRESLERALEGAAEEEPRCVVAQFDPGPGTVEQVLRDAASTRHHQVLLVLTGLSKDDALVAAGIDALLSEAAASRPFDESRAANADAVWDPVLVLRPSGQLTWAAGSEPTARLLNTLTDREAEGAWAKHGPGMSVAEVREVVPDVEEYADVLRRARLDRGAFRVDDTTGRVQLAVHPADLLRAAGHRLAADVRERIAVRRGREYLTPSLQFTRAWIDFNQAAHALGVLDVAFAALRAEVSAPGAVLLGDSYSKRRLLGRLATMLGCRRAVRLPHYATSELPGHGRLLEPGQRVVVHSDVLVSGESVRRCVKQVLRDGGEVAAVTCFVDARDDAGEPLAVADGEPRVRVVCIAHVPEIRGTGTAPFDVISPLTGRVERPGDDAVPATRAPALASDDGLAEALLAAGAFHFSHVARPRGRHFTFWLDHRKVLRLPVVRRRIRQEFREWARAAFGEQEGGWAEIAVWYPATTGDDAVALGEVAEWLRAEERRHIVEVQPVPRIAAGGRWLFPGASELSAGGRAVVVVDWGSLDGSTVAALVDLAARSGARHVFVCLALSQLPPEIGRFYTDLSELRIHLPGRAEGDATGRQLDLLQTEEVEPPSASTREHVAHVRVRFATTFAPGVFQSLGCPVCAQVAGLADVRPASPLLHEFLARRVHQRLRPRHPDEVADGAPVGVDGGPLAPEELRGIAEWRLWLDAAMGQTTVRAAMVERLARLAQAEASTGASPEDRRALATLMHLLSVETQWLRLPPLEFKQARRALCALATKIALDPEAPVTGRLHALIVLRIASRRAFVAELEALFRSCASQPLLAAQVLFSTFTYVAREHSARQSTLEPVRRHLRALVEALDAGALPCPADGAAALRDLHRYTEYRFGESGARRISASDAWATLREQFARESRAAEAAFAAFAAMDPAGSYLGPRVAAWARGHFEARLSQASLAWIAKLEERWATVRAWVEMQLLPLARTLGPLLASPEFGLDASLADWLHRQWESTRGVVDPLGDAVADVVRERTSPPAPDVWERYVNAWQRWRLHLISSGTHMSHLDEWIRDAPAALEPAAVAARQRLAEEQVRCEVEATPDAARDLFCTQRVLNNALAELSVLMYDAVDAAAGEQRPSVRISFTARREEVGGRVRVAVQATVLAPALLMAPPAALAPADLDALRVTFAPFGGTFGMDRAGDGAPVYVIELPRLPVVEPHPRAD
jgi:orotate phosphoribosyltransferase